MKIFYETSYLKQTDIDQLIIRFPDIEFTCDDQNTKGVTAILAMPGYLSNDNLDRYRDLRWIQVLTAGYDQLDLKYIKSRNIILTNAKDVFSIQIAEDVFSKILYFNRNLAVHHEHMKQSIWKHEPVLYEIDQSTIGILGTGSIGLEIAKRMKAFNTTILGYRKTQVTLPDFNHIYSDAQGLEEIYQKSDILIICLPLTEQTYHLIDKKAFSMMKPNVIVINVARGEIIDQNALIEALKTKQIRAAGLDVTTPEPLPKKNDLWKFEQVLITPHNASASPYVRKRLIHAVSDAIYLYINQLEFNNRII